MSASTSRQEIIAAYADLVASATRDTDRGTMRVARVMDEEYLSGEWVEEWLEQKPEPKRPTSRWNPADRNRYIAWQAWKLQQAGHTPLHRIRSFQLLEAAHIARSVTGVTDLAEERPLRPFGWMRKNQYDNRIPEVWDLAVEMAGGNPGDVTDKHTREALAEWKRRTFPKRDGSPRKNPASVSRAANAAAKLRRIRREMMRELEESFALAVQSEDAKGELMGMLNEIETYVNAHITPDEEAA